MTDLGSIVPWHWRHTLPHKPRRWRDRQVHVRAGPHGRMAGLWRGPRELVFAPDHWSFGMVGPEVDMIESEDAIRITAELPSVHDGDIEITLGDGLLVIDGEKKPQPGEERVEYLAAERAFGTFRRALPLPCAVDEQKANATFEAGILTVVLPRKAEGRKVRRVAVTVA